MHIINALKLFLMAAEYSGKTADQSNRLDLHDKVQLRNVRIQIERKGKTTPSGAV